MVHDQLLLSWVSWGFRTLLLGSRRMHRGSMCASMRDGGAHDRGAIYSVAINESYGFPNDFISNSCPNAMRSSCCGKGRAESEYGMGVLLWR